MKFEQLVQAIASIHEQTQSSAAKAVNMALTCRNWLIGAYIQEYELQGEDRANYRDRVVDSLATELRRRRVPSCERRRLYEYRNFYLAYPQLAEALPLSGSSEVLRFPLPPGIVRSLTAQSEEELTGEIVRSLTAQTGTGGKLLLERLSWTHLQVLTDIDDPLKRQFYEVEAIKGNWSVRELKRQIASLYFERSGLSHDKEQLSRIANAGAELAEPRQVIRDPYVFEFLGLRPQEVLPESELEAALLVELQRFLLELGNGFCFEARQKRIVIGGDAFFVDLVFYHRILKCHVLVELKVDEFRHEHLGQLNTYVSFYRGEMMEAGDQPPVGILLCTGKNHALVEYALAGMDNQLFVSKYQVALPDAEKLQRYLEKQKKHLEDGDR